MESRVRFNFSEDELLGFRSSSFIQLSPSHPCPARITSKERSRASSSLTRRIPLLSWLCAQKQIPCPEASETSMVLFRRKTGLGALLPPRPSRKRQVLCPGEEASRRWCLGSGSCVSLRIDSARWLLIPESCPVRRWCCFQERAKPQHQCVSPRPQITEVGLVTRNRFVSKVHWSWEQTQIPCPRARGASV